MCPQNSGHSVPRMTQRLKKVSLVKGRVLAYFALGWCPGARTVPGTSQVLISKSMLNKQMNTWRLSDGTVF